MLFILKPFQNLLRSTLNDQTFIKPNLIPQFGCHQVAPILMSKFMSNRQINSVSAVFGGNIRIINKSFDSVCVETPN